MWDCVGCLFEKKRLLGKTLASWQDKDERKQFNHAPSDKARARRGRALDLTDQPDKTPCSCPLSQLACRVVRIVQYGSKKTKP